MSDVAKSVVYDLIDYLDKQRVDVARLIVRMNASLPSPVTRHDLYALEGHVSWEVYEQLLAEIHRDLGDGWETPFMKQAFARPNHSLRLVTTLTPYIVNPRLLYFMTAKLARQRILPCLHINESWQGRRITIHFKHRDGKTMSQLFAKYITAAVVQVPTLIGAQQAETSFSFGKDDLSITSTPPRKPGIWTKIKRISRILTSGKVLLDETLMLDEYTRQRMEKINNLQAALTSNGPASSKEIMRVVNRMELVRDLYPIGIFYTDNGGKLVYANKTFLSLFGFEETSQLDMDWMQHLLPADYDRLQSAWEKNVAEDYQGFEDEVQLVDEMNIRTLQIKVHPEFADEKQPSAVDNVPLGYVGTVTDVTQHHQQQSALETYAKRLLDTHILSRTGYWDYNPQTNSISFSREIARLIGLDNFPRSYCFDEALHINVHPDDRDIARQYFSALSETKKPLESVFRIINPKTKESLWLAHRAQAIQLRNQNRMVIGTSFDITQFKLSEEQLNLAKERAERADNLKSVFLSNMSHEIRTPMTAIMGFAGYLEELASSDKEKQYTRIIKRNGEKLLELINDLLDIAKIESGHIEINRQITDIRQDIEELIDLHRVRRSENTLHLRVNVEDTVPDYVVTDPKLFRQILGNLVANAFKFTTAGEINIYVHWNPLQCDNGTEGDLVISVQDTGIGMDLEKQDQLFRPFSQLHSIPMSQGSGLGLCLSRNIARALRGDIELAQSIPGIGSKFVITIPMVKSEDISAADPAAHRQAELPRLSGFRILIVEDNDDLAALMCEMLQRLDCEILVANNAQLAISTVAREHLDLVFMDIGLPDMSGLDATRRIRKELGCPVTIIALTAYASSEDHRMALDAGCDDFLTKPVSRGKFAAVLDAHLANHAAREDCPIPKTTGEQQLSQEPTIH